MDLNLDNDIYIYNFANEFSQALINILHNASDAIDSKLKETDLRIIRITTKQINDEVIIEIIDNAGGIDKEIINKIFEPYFTTKHQNIGTGIGLSMAYKMITQRHNASIDVYNDKYEYNNKKYNGACFKITFQSNFK